MIQQCFTFLPGISEKLDRAIKKQGVKDWDAFLSVKSIKGISKKRKYFYDKELRKAKEALFNENVEYFARMKETWRLYDHFKDEVCFLDIEGIGNDIILIGLFDGYDTKTMVKNVNLYKELLEAELKKYKLLVTFNGSSYDLPKIKRYFNLDINIPHIDLRHLCNRMNLNGGLKQVEEMLGIDRPQHLKGTGEIVVDLWRTFLASGDRGYLDLLVRYNEEDVINLKPVADFVIRHLKAISI